MKMKNKFTWFFVALFFLAMSSGTTFAQTVVTSTDDSGPGTLREAITNATAGETITFDAALAGETITISSTIAVTASAITISGSSQTIVPAAGGVDRAFNVSGNGFTMERLHIDGFGNEWGAGVFSSAGDGDLVFKSCIFTNNKALGGQGGGAIARVWGGSGRISVYGCTFIGNEQNENHGSAIFNHRGGVDVIGCVFYGNDRHKTPDYAVKGESGTSYFEYNAVDRDLYGETSNPQEVGTVVIASNPFDAEFVTTDPALQILPDPLPANYPAVDFWGNAIVAGGYIGGAQAGAPVPPQTFTYTGAAADCDGYNELFLAPWGSAGGVIVYTIETTSAGTLTFDNTLAAATEGRSFNVFIYDEANGNVDDNGAYDFSWNADKYDAQWTYDLNASSKYYLLLYPSEGGLFEAEDIFFEASVPADAVVTPLGATITYTDITLPYSAYIDDDKDASGFAYYKIVLDAAGTLTINSNNNDIWVLDGNKSELYYGYDAVYSDHLAAGTYYIKIYDYYGGNLSINISFEADPPEYFQTWTIPAGANVGDTWTLVDNRDDKSYQVVKMADGRIWLAQNFEYTEGLELTDGLTTPGNTDDALYYDYTDRDNTDRWGVFYGWNAAQVAVPAGWHIPSNDEARALITALKAQYGDDDKTVRNVLSLPNDALAGYDYYNTGSYSDMLDNTNATGFGAIGTGCISQNYGRDHFQRLFRTWTNQGKFEFGGGYGPAVESFSATEYFVLRFIKNDPSVVTSWEIGAVNPEDVVATFDPQTGVLTISGTGDMKAFPSNYDYNVTSAPWVLEDATTGTFYPYRDDITSIVIEEGVTNITGVAWGLNNLGGTLTIPSTVTTIGSRAFNGHSFTGEIVIPEGVTTIGSYAFDDNGNSTVTSLKLPSTWDNTGGQYQIFDHMSLTDVYVTTSTTPIAIQNPAGAMFSASTFANATLHIPAGTLDDYQADAFWSRFTNIIEEASVVTSWEIGAVNPSDVVADLNLETGVLTISGTGAMLNFPMSYGGVKVGGGAPWVGTMTGAEDYQADTWEPYPYTDAITSIIVEEGVTNIGVCFAWGITQPYTISLPSTITTIGTRAFSGHQISQSTITVPEGVTTIGSYGFEGAAGNAVKTVYLPSTYAPNAAYHVFNGMDLNNVYIPATTPPAFPEPEPSGVFSANTFTGAILHVPYGTTDAYAAAIVWMNFVNIEEDAAPQPLFIEVELPYTATGTYADIVNEGLTGTYADTNGDGGAAGFTFTIDEEGELTIVAEGYDLYLFDDESVAAPELTSGSGGITDFAVQPGTYYLVIDDYENNDGDYDLSITFGPLTAINTAVGTKAVKSTKYINVLGQPVSKDAKGIIFQEILYEDGTKAFRKTIVLEK